MGSEHDWHMPGGEDYGGLLARTLGWSPIYVRYNSGRAIADNGADLAALLETLVATWPVDVKIRELVLLGHSLGGLVARAACHAAGEAAWLRLVTRAIYLGTPHQGAPMERFGRGIARVLHAIPDPYTQLIAQLGDLRSAAIKDLGDADLRHADRVRQPRGVSLLDAAHPVPLLPHIQHRLVAGSLADPRLAMLFGDGIVPMSSATHRPPGTFTTIKMMPGISHMRLAHHPEVGAEIIRWCGQ